MRRHARHRVFAVFGGIDHSVFCLLIHLSQRWIGYPSEIPNDAQTPKERLILPFSRLATILVKILKLIKIYVLIRHLLAKRVKYGCNSRGALVAGMIRL
jgi:hypothetical protein